MQNASSQSKVPTADRGQHVGYLNRRGLVSTFLKFCGRKGWISANPIIRTPTCRIAHRRGAAHALTAEQAAELMQYLETYEGAAVVPYFALCLFAGIRPSFTEGEISRLKQDAISATTLWRLEVLGRLGAVQDIRHKHYACAEVDRFLKGEERPRR